MSNGGDGLQARAAIEGEGPAALARADAEARDTASGLAQPGRRAQILTVLDAALALMSVMLVTQMWLLTATVESVLAGHHSSALPGAVLSAVLFAGCAGLLGFTRRLERRIG